MYWLQIFSPLKEIAFLISQFCISKCYLSCTFKLLIITYCLWNFYSFWGVSVAIITPHNSFPCNTHNVTYLLVLSSWEAEREIENIRLPDLFHKCHNGQVRAELKLGSGNSITSPTWVAETQVLEPALLLPRVFISRKLESGLEPRLEPSRSNLGHTQCQTLAALTHTLLKQKHKHTI